MKKKLKIILIIVAVLLVVILYFGYMIYREVSGNEKITGKQDKIPSPMVTIPPISKAHADWPNWRGKDLNGKSATTGIKKDWSNGLKKLWQADYLCQDKLTASWSAPVVQGNRVVVPGRDAKRDLIFCINTEDGKLIWLSSYESDAGTSHGAGARATPFIDDDRVYTLGRSGDLVCWRLEDGKLVWKKNLKDIGGQEPQWGYSTSPLVINNKVMVQGGGKSLAIAFDKITGDVLWKSLEGEAGYAASMLINVENEIRLLIYHANGLSCLNIEDGKELWHTPWVTNYGVNATTPVVENNIIFHTAGYDMGGQAIQVKRDGFSILWKNNVIASQHSDPIVINGYIYGYSGESNGHNGRFKCVELVSGKEVWSTNKIGWGTTIYVDGHLICLDIKGNLYLIKPNPTNFQKVAEFKAAIENVSNPAWTAPVVANGKLYLRYMQQLVCYNLMP